jgi:hypothetical protein
MGRSRNYPGKTAPVWLNLTSLEKKENFFSQLVNHTTTMELVITKPIRHVIAFSYPNLS